jgi:WD repeat-containing protein 19
MVAKAKESENNYKEAESAYERANDWENIIRLNLDPKVSFHSVLK